MTKWLLTQRPEQGQINQNSSIDENRAQEDPLLTEDVLGADGSFYFYFRGIANTRLSAL